MSRLRCSMHPHNIDGCACSVRSDGSTPLFVAARKGRAAIVDALIAAESNVNAADKVVTSIIMLCYVL